MGTRHTGTAATVAGLFQSPVSATSWAASGVADPQAGPVVKQPNIRAHGIAFADVALVGPTGIDLGIVTAVAIETEAGWVISDLTVRETIVVAENWPA